MMLDCMMCKWIIGPFHDSRLLPRCYQDRTNLIHLATSRGASGFVISLGLGCLGQG